MDIQRYVKEAHDYFITAGDTSENIVELLMRVIEELGAASVAHREGRICDWPFEEDYVMTESHWKMLFNHNIKDTHEDHLAMAFIRLFDLCGYLGIEPEVDHLCSEISLEINVAESFLTVTEFICYINNKDKTDPTPIKTELDIIFSSLSDFCGRLYIPIQKHIEARLAYMRASL